MSSFCSLPGEFFLSIKFDYRRMECYLYFRLKQNFSVNTNWNMKNWWFFLVNFEWRIGWELTWDITALPSRPPTSLVISTWTLSSLCKLNHAHNTPISFLYNGFWLMCCRIVEPPAKIISVLIMDLLSRRTIFCGGLITSGLFCLATGLVPSGKHA